MKKLISVILSVFLFCAAAPLVSADETLAKRETININTASTEALASLDGIGEVKAEAIVAWRQENGDFVSIDQLVEVSGIGEATVEANRDLLRVNK